MDAGALFAAIGVGLFVGTFYAVAERSFIFGSKVGAFAAVAAFIFGNLFG